MLSARYRSDYVQNLKEQNDVCKGGKESVRHGEWKIAIFALFFSIFVITAKVLNAKRKNIYNFFYQDQLISYETIEQNGEIMLHYVRQTVATTSYFFIPLLCGLLMTLFTWTMVYLDSSIPGVYPPTPFSPEKYKKQSGHIFHLGYIIAVVNGLLVFLLMLVNRLEIF